MNVVFLLFLVLFAVAAALILYSFVLIRRSNESIRSSDGRVCPGVRNPFSVLTRIAKDPHFQGQAQLEDFKKYGPVHQTWFGFRKVIAVTDPLLVPNILRSNIDGYALKRLQLPDDPFVDQLFGESIIRLDSASWMHQRLIMEPAFRYTHLRKMVSIFCDGANGIVSQWKQQIPDDKQGEVKIDVLKWMTRLTLDMIGLAGFGFDFGARLNDSPVLAPYQEAYEATMNFIMFPLRFIIPAFSRCRFIPVVRHAYEHLERLEELMLNVIRSKRAQLEQQLQAHGPSVLRQANDDDNDLLSLMLAAQHIEEEAEEEEEEGFDHSNAAQASSSMEERKESQKKRKKQRQLATPLTDKQLKDNLFLLFVAGHETSASALCWALYELAHNPAIQQRARDEVDATFSKRPQQSTHSNHQLSFDELSKMEYLHAILRETLRLWTPAVAVLREISLEDQPNANKPSAFKLGDYEIPDHLLIVVNLFAIHHDPKLWPEPSRFDPERFLSTSDSSRPAYAWMPFSAGPRACIGSKFSLLEMKITLALILKDFEVLPDPDYKLGFARGITLRPENLSLIFRQRSSNIH